MGSRNHHPHNRHSHRHSNHHKNKHRTDRKNHHRTQRKENNRGLNKNTKKLIILIVAVLVGIIILNELLGLVDGIWAFTLVWILGFVIITIIVIAIWLFMVALKGWASRRL